VYGAGTPGKGIVVRTVGGSAGGNAQCCSSCALNVSSSKYCIKFYTTRVSPEFRPLADIGLLTY
jgi:hypothetical protein